MHGATANPATRSAIAEAHQARARAFRAILARLIRPARPDAVATGCRTCPA
ncbi:hypothetical protein [Maritimibacter sp. 55A14]|uniref:hypothetical protein n=1 Tax=Maritimibacter sp. 55A14 TaxID=2174844 RepID=UPI001304BF1A|nr:hypothetical protein [Maritimibacter sp. 55A14]